MFLFPLSTTTVLLFFLLYLHHPTPSFTQSLQSNPNTHVPQKVLLTKPQNPSQTSLNSSKQPNETPQRIVRIAKLLQHSRQLHRQILFERHHNQNATANFQTSLKRLSDISAARALTQKSLNFINDQLKQYRRQIPLYARTIDILHRQAGAAILEINRLRTSKYSVMHEKALLQSHFRHRGLEAWVHNYVKHVNPLVAGAVVEGTADVVQPMMDGIETLAAVNQDFARRMTTHLGESVPIVETPFYSGFVTYTVLLFPLVLVTSVLMKVKRSLTNFSVGHLVILTNFYFTLLSGGCFIATLLGAVDVLRTFRHVNLGLFDLVMVLHGILYIIHISLHVLMAVRVRDKPLILHTVLLILIGAHFFIHSYLHAMHNEDPHVDKKAYAIYTAVFAYVLYNWTVKHIRMSMETTRMKLNNKSITTIDDQALAAVAVNPTATPLHLPLKQKNSASSRMSYALPEDNYSRVETVSRGEIRVDNIFFSPPTVSRERDSSTRPPYAAPSSVQTIVPMKADDPKDL